jgi:hypothetical protein
MTKYSRIHVDGYVVDEYTASSVAQVKTLFPLLGGTGTVHLAQGGYDNGAVAASAGTHNGGGCVDFSLSDKTQANWQILEKAARMAMFAAWHRTPLYRNGSLVWSDHVHAVQIGNDLAAHLAKQQVQDYYAHKSGLVGEAPDNDWRPNVLFTPNYKLGAVNLTNMARFAHKPNAVPRPGVIAIQRALNLKHGANLRVNGIYNAQTKRAYGEFAKVIGGNPDGVPRFRSLSILGAGKFNAV